MMSSTKIVVMVVSSAVALAACDTTTGVKGRGSVSLSFAVPAVTTSRQAIVLADPITVGGHTVNLTSADVTFSRIKLEKAEVDTGKVEDDRNETHDGPDIDDEESVKFDSATIALPLNGGVITPISKPIPLGDYESIELSVASVRARGTYDGQSFDVVVPVHAKFAQRFSPPLHVAATTDKVNVTIKIDTNRWLKNADGTLIDPRTITITEQVRARVAGNIRASFKSFRDGNRDGRDDDHDEH